MSRPTRRAFSSASRNHGIPLDMGWVRGLSLSRDSVVRRVDRAENVCLPAEPGREEALLRVLAAIDLTTLSGDDTEARVRRLCRTARTPLSGALRRRLGPGKDSTRVAAVCVFPAFVPLALKSLSGTDIPVATVAGGFPHGLATLTQKVHEVSEAARLGAHEIDVVTRREWALSGDWPRLYKEVRALKDAAGPALLKVILGTGDLRNPNQIGRAGLTALMGGADFLKTSTGKEEVNATLSAGVALLEVLKRYRKRTGFLGGLKPAGGIRTAREGHQWLRLVQEELGPEATDPAHFRIGASDLLPDIVEALEG